MERRKGMEVSYLHLLWILLAFASLASPAGAQAEVKRRALIVGVNEYQNRKLADLLFAERDARELDAALRAWGFETDLLVGRVGPKAPSRVNFLNSLDLLLKRASRKDLLVFAFAGHGVTIVHDAAQGPTPFLCANDSIPTQTETLISVREIIRRMEESGGAANLLLLDACRNDPDPGGRKTGIDAERMPPLGEGMAVFFACAPGQRARESPKLAGGHGLFFRAVIEGVRGGAANSKKEVTWDRLAAYVKDQVPSHWKENFPQLPKEQVQTPHLVSNLASTVTIAECVAPRSFRQTDRPVVYVNSIGMKFRLVPAGSSQWEIDEKIAKAFDLSPGKQTVEVKRPFYLGVYEVTRGQFLQFVRATGYVTSARRVPNSRVDVFSEFSKWMVDGTFGFDWSDVGFPQTDEHPIVCATHQDALEFCEWLGRKERRAYRLPTSQEWEFAFRADVKDGPPWGDRMDNIALFGNTCDSQVKEHVKYAICNKLKDNFIFTAPVGSFKPNGWGFYDMIGNASEWCSDDYETAEAKDMRLKFLGAMKEGEAYKAIAGGSWLDPYSRSWFRNPSECRMNCLAVANVGFRIALEAD